MVAEDERTCVSNLFKKLKDDEIITMELFYEVYITYYFNGLLVAIV